MSFEDDPKVLQWAPLVCNNAPQEVQLFYEFSSSPTGLCFSVTDLRFVWKTSLTREEVENKAQQQNCSIDPSESTSQLRTLLTKLNQSVAEGHNDLGRPQTRTIKSLYIRTRSTLPAPLKLLVWSFDLEQQDSAHLAEAITFPLLHEAILMKQQMETLFQIIKDKDHVLTKLLDKIDNSAMDLSLIFPGITGMKSRKQKFGVAEASKHVPGMATFVRSLWEASLRRSHTGQGTGDTAFTNILSNTKINLSSGFTSTDWIQNLPRLSEHTMTGTSNESENENDGQDIEKPKRKQPAKTESNHGGSETESDLENLENTPRKQREKKEQVQRPDSPPPERQAEAAKLASGSPIPSQASKSARKRSKSDSSSDSDSDGDPNRSETTSKQVTSKIGMLGGKRKADPSPTPSPPRLPSNVSTPSRKPGVLGGRRAPTKSSSKSPVSLRTRPKTPEAANNAGDSDTASSASSTPAAQVSSIKSTIKTAALPVIEEPAKVEESIEERAKRKREELKRNQAQANAGLAKKKARRF